MDLLPQLWRPGRFSPSVDWVSFWQTLNRKKKPLLPTLKDRVNVMAYCCELTFRVPTTLAWPPPRMSRRGADGVPVLLRCRPKYRCQALWRSVRSVDGGTVTVMWIRW